MQKVCFSLIGGLLVAGCAGLDIKTLKAADVSAARASGLPLQGYVVYEPVVTVEISVQEVCLGGKDDKGKCTGKLVTQCTATTPFLLPDYSKPYQVSSKTGFGKAGVDVTIADGWRLGAIKDSSDNTAILSALGLKTSSEKTASAPGAACKPAGLYRVVLEGEQIRLAPLQLY